jgi:hypothetical protein
MYCNPVTFATLCVSLTRVIINDQKWPDVLILNSDAGKIYSTVLEWFYPIFRRLMPRQTFMYAACGGVTTMLGYLSFLLVTILFSKKNWFTSL